MNSIDLPSEGYTYLVCSEDRPYAKCIRIKEIASENSAKAWLKRLMDLTRVTWRVKKTYPSCGRINIFKVDMRCQHATDKRSKGLRRTKNTDCPATLQIVVKKHLAKSHAKKKDHLTHDWPCVVTFVYDHNHLLDSAAVLRYRDMSQATREKLVALFRQGHTPSSALRYLEAELSIEHDDDYHKYATDGFYLPSLSRIQKVFDSEGRTESTPLLPHCHLPSQIVKPAKDDFSMDDCIVANVEEIPYEERSCLCDDSNGTVDDSISKSLTEDEKLEFHTFLTRINDGLTDNSHTFVPAVRAMLKNIRRYAKTEAGIVTALRMFACPRNFLGVKKTRRKSQNKRTKCTASETAECYPRNPSSDLPLSVTRILDHEYTNLGVPCLADDW